MSKTCHACLTVFVVAALAQRACAEDAKEKDAASNPSEHTMLLRYLPKGHALLGETFQASWADQPWWGVGSVFLKRGVDGLDWNIAADDIARVRQEIEAVPFSGSAPVFECRGKWIVESKTGQRRLLVTSPPRRLQRDERGLLRCDEAMWQPDLWRGDYWWLIEKGKHVKELAGEYVRLTADLKKAKVPSAQVALALAVKDSGSNFETPHGRIGHLERAVIDLPGFAKRGELIWVVQSIWGSDPAAPRVHDQITINAHTAVAYGTTNGKRRSLAVYLPQVESR